MNSPAPVPAIQVLPGLGWACLRARPGWRRHAVGAPLPPAPTGRFERLISAGVRVDLFACGEVKSPPGVRSFEGSQGPGRPLRVMVVRRVRMVWR